MRWWIPEASDPLYWIASFDEQTSRRQVGKRHARRLVGGAGGVLIGGDYGEEARGGWETGRPRTGPISAKEKKGRKNGWVRKI